MSAFAIVDDKLQVCKDGENWETIGTLKTIEHLASINKAQSNKIYGLLSAMSKIRDITSDVFVNELEEQE